MTAHCAGVTRSSTEKPPVGQDGPAHRVPGRPSGRLLGAPHALVGVRTAGSAERGHAAAGRSGDQRPGVHRGALFTFCAVRGDATNTQRIGGGGG